MLHAFMVLKKSQRFVAYL